MSAKSQPSIAGHLSERRRVRFDFFHSTAKRVCVAGDFNGWNPTATPLRSLGDGRWLRELRLPLRNHEYLLVVDGEWKFDPKAVDYMPNAFGGMNSVLEVLGEYPSRRCFAESPSCLLENKKGKDFNKNEPSAPFGSSVVKGGTRESRSTNKTKET